MDQKGPSERRRAGVRTLRKRDVSRGWGEVLVRVEKGAASPGQWAPPGKGREQGAQPPHHLGPVGILA